MFDRKTVRPYRHPAGGWGALKAVSEHLIEQHIPLKGAVTLGCVNQPAGFDCPGCAWPDPKHTSSFEFCENGAKAVAWEATSKRCTPEFFANHSVTELLGWGDYHLEMVGRLTHPMAYDAVSDHYVPVSWEAAFAVIGRHLNALPDPNMAEFYTSGRTSNEAAFLYQLFAREYGTNNFPDCSNMCHEATSVGLPLSIGVGKGTVLLEDFDEADCIFIFGQNPGTNSPRMMTNLRNASRRGASIISFNPFRERALERFQHPQHPVEMATLTSTPISSQTLPGPRRRRYGRAQGHDEGYDRSRRGGARARRAGNSRSGLRRGHTVGIEALGERPAGDQMDRHRTPVRPFAPGDRACRAGLHEGRARNHRLRHGHHPASPGRAKRPATGQPCSAPRQHRARRAPALCPVRGHSNVQGDRTVGITEIARRKNFLDRLERQFRFQAAARAWPQRRHRARGHDPRRGEGVCRAGRQFRRRDSRLAGDTSGIAKSRPHRSCLDQAEPQPSDPRPGRTDLALSRPDRDRHPGVGAAIHHGRRLDVDGPCVRGSQQAGVGTSAQRTGNRRGNRQGGARRPNRRRLGRLRRKLRPHPRRDRTRISDLPGYNARIRVPGGFHLVSTARERIGRRLGKSNFLVFDGLGEDFGADDPAALWLSTIRSHDQYNTTLYSMSDRYRGVHGRRDVVFLNQYEMENAICRTATGSTWSPVDRRHRAQGTQLPGGRLLVSGWLLCGVLSGDQSAGATLRPRSAELHAVVEGHSDLDRAHPRRHAEQCRNCGMTQTKDNNPRRIDSR